MHATASAAFNPGDRTYLQEISKFPMLSAEEEQRLVRAWRDDHDIAAADKLVTSHLRLVAKIAQGHRGYGMPLGELISQGNVGLVQAVKRFDPERGFRFATYAMWWIRSAMQEHVLHNWSLVKIGTTAAQKKLFFNLQRLKAQMRAVQDGDLTFEQVSEIATILQVPEQEVIAMNRRLGRSDHSLNTPVRPDSDSDWQDSLVDTTDDQETMFADREEMSSRMALLSGALHVLNQREMHILQERRFKEVPTKLETLAQHYGVSRERIRQIEANALQKLRKEMQAPQREGLKKAA